MKKLILTILILISAAFASKSIVELPFTYVNVGPSTMDAVGELFKTELIHAGYDVVMDTQICKEIACAGEVARRRHVEMALYGSIVGVGEKIVVTAYFVRSDDEIVYTDRATAITMNDLDVVVKRIVDAFSSGKSVKNAAKIDNITEKETLTPKRREEFYTVGSRVGYFVPFYGSKSKSSALLGFDAIGMYETDRWIIEALVGFHGFDEYESFIPIDLSGLYLFSNGDYSPYASVGLGVHLLAQTEVDYNGNYTYYDYKLPVVSLGGGVLFFRTYKFHVTVDGRGWFSFGKPWYQGFNISFGLTLKSEPGHENSSKIGCCWGF